MVGSGLQDVFPAHAVTADLLIARLFNQMGQMYCHAERVSCSSGSSNDSQYSAVVHGYCSYVPELTGKVHEAGVR